MANQIIIEAYRLFDGKSSDENLFIIIEDDKIIDITKNKLKADFSGIVTPAFIDAHSHIGLDRQGEPYQEGEANEMINQIMPLNNPLNSVYFDDRAFSEAVDFGVLYSCIVPGSGNVLGGRAVIIKNFENTRDKAFFKDYGFKMALGYNPRSTTDWKGTRPYTRMGIYSMIEERFDKLLVKKKKAIYDMERKMDKLALDIKEKKVTKQVEIKRRDMITDEYILGYSPEDRALLEILEKKKTIKVHVHKEDDVLYLINFVQKYGLNVTADHVCDVHHKEIFNELAKNKIPVVYGPLGAFDYKVELKHAFYNNTKLLMQSDAFFGLMTDHPVILSPLLRESLKYFLIQGMAEEDAISLITYKNSKILGIDDTLGTIEPNKTASLVVWNKSPFNLGAFPLAVIAEGRIVRGK